MFAVLAMQEEFAKERAQVDAVVANIEEQDRQEVAARKARQMATRDYVQSFLEEQQRLKQRKQQQVEAEDARSAMSKLVPAKYLCRPAYAPVLRV